MMKTLIIPRKADTHLKESEHILVKINGKIPRGSAGVSSLLHSRYLGSNATLKTATEETYLINYIHEKNTRFWLAESSAV